MVLHIDQCHDLAISMSSITIELWKNGLNLYLLKIFRQMKNTMYCQKLVDMCPTDSGDLPVQNPIFIPVKFG